MAYLSGPELHPPANGRVRGRRLKTHGLPVSRLDILRNKIKHKLYNIQLKFSVVYKGWAHPSEATNDLGLIWSDSQAEACILERYHSITQTKVLTTYSRIC